MYNLPYYIHLLICIIWYRASAEVAPEGAPSMGAKSLCIPLEQPEPKIGSAGANGTRCINPKCSKDPQSWTLFGRSYWVNDARVIQYIVLIPFDNLYVLLQLFFNIFKFVCNPKLTSPQPWNLYRWCIISLLTVISIFHVVSTYGLSCLISFSHSALFLSKQTVLIIQISIKVTTK